MREQGVPFVLVTGYGSERLHEEALQDAPYLRKPVAADEFARALEILARPERG